MNLNILYSIMGQLIDDDKLKELDTERLLAYYKNKKQRFYYWNGTDDEHRLLFAGSTTDAELNQSQREELKQHTAVRDHLRLAKSILDTRNKTKVVL